MTKPFVLMRVNVAKSALGKTVFKFMAGAGS